MRAKGAQKSVRTGSVRAGRTLPNFGESYHPDIAEPPATYRRVLRLLSWLLPPCVCLAWLPLRDRLPNTDLALVLVVVVAVVGFEAGRASALLGALTAGVAFDVLHTRPYGHLEITHGRDVLTTALLVVAGIAMGEVAHRLSLYREVAGSNADAFALVTDAAGLVATGGEASLVIEALCAELKSGLKLSECRFEEGPPKGEAPFVNRDGALVYLEESVSAPVNQDLDLPVWVTGEIVARFRLEIGDLMPSPAQLRLAMNVADQAGAAVGSHPESVPPPVVNRRN
ncbi:MAG: DUF4118 domain-containing protein, partial [Nitrososphaerales archaeon]